MDGTSAHLKTSSKVARKSIPSMVHIASPPPSILKSGKTGASAAAQVLCDAFDAREEGRLFEDPLRGGVKVPEENVFLVGWVDYTHKYGLGYALTDGTIGVDSNNGPSMILSPDKKREGHDIRRIPKKLKSKVFLLKHFDGYITRRLHQNREYIFERGDGELQMLKACRLPPASGARYWTRSSGTDFEGRGFEWLLSYFLMKDATIFRFSHDVFQFNFRDHIKVVLSYAAMRVTYIGPGHKRHSYTLQELMAYEYDLDGYSQVDETEAKALRYLVQKLEYCKRVLVSISNSN